MHHATTHTPIPSAQAPALPPTMPAAVTADTPLEALNLDWRERDLPERERTKHVHRLHPYLGKYIPQLVEVFLRKYFRPGHTVLDPFCGSGTTLVQANELGIHSIGYDICAFNVLLSRVKTASYDLPRLQHEIHDALHKTQTHNESRAAQLSLWPTQAEDAAMFHTDSEYLRRWFAPRALRQLLAYRHVVENGDYWYKDALRIILSRSARSARLTTHFNLDFPKEPQTQPYWCYKHSRQCEPTTEALKFLERYSLDTVRRIAEFSQVRTDARVQVVHGDSRSAPIPPVDGVITSPPYVGLIDYHEQHAYAYHLLNLRDAREQEIGPAAGGASGRARAEYVEAMVQVLGAALQAMPPGGPMVIVAADRAHLYPEIAARLGVRVDGTVKRHVNRRTGRRAGEFYESVFAWRKP